MCDTIVALGNSTADKSVLFAKNSDRDPNEAQYIQTVEGEAHSKGSLVKCTYINIPQVEKTYSILLSKPFWIWGTEMGANEHGVVIGNEAVFSKIPQKKEPSLIGMDLLRLGLERSTSAVDALKIIIDLLEVHGQAGNCGFSHPFAYDNSFLIADKKEAWVLETADRHWVVEKVKDIRSISNIYTIETEWYEASKDLVEIAIHQGWCKTKADFNFKRCYSDFIYSTFAAGRSRHACTTEFLKNNIGKITLGDMINLLRMHGSKRSEDWTPGKALMGADVCMHLGYGPIRISQTTGSMVSHLTANQDVHWLTGTAAPCLGIFKPIWLDTGIPDIGPEPKGEYDPKSLWWKGERLHRQVLLNYPACIKEISGKRNSLEEQFIANSSKMMNLSKHDRVSFSEECFRSSIGLLDELTLKVDEIVKEENIPFYHKAVWQKYNKQAAIPI